MKSIILGAIGLGFLLLVLSGVWSSMFPATSSWTPEKAERSSEIKNRLHNLAFIVNDPRRQARMHGGPDMAQLKAEYEQLQEESDQLNAAFQSAYDRPNTVVTVLKWTGISLAGLGIVGWLAVRDS